MLMLSKVIKKSSRNSLELIPEDDQVKSIVAFSVTNEALEEDIDLEENK